MPCYCVYVVNAPVALQPSWLVRQVWRWSRGEFPRFWLVGSRERPEGAMSVSKDKVHTVPERKGKRFLDDSHLWPR